MGAEKKMRVRELFTKLLLAEALVGLAAVSYTHLIIGRMGIPYRAKGISIISIAIDAPQDKISALSGKIGHLKGISAKTAYSNVITPAEGGADD